MKKIYVSHSTHFDFKNELYAPLKKLSGFELVFPHEKSGERASSKNAIQDCSALIAEVSTPSHGVGIEIGWADAFAKPIILIFRKNTKPAKSLEIVSKTFIEYERLEDALPELQEALEKATH